MNFLMLFSMFDLDIYAVFVVMNNITVEAQELELTSIPWRLLCFYIKQTSHLDFD